MGVWVYLDPLSANRRNTPTIPRGDRHRLRPRNIMLASKSAIRGASRASRLTAACKSGLIERQLLGTFSQANRNLLLAVANCWGRSSRPAEPRESCAPTAALSLLTNGSATRRCPPIIAPLWAARITASMRLSVGSTAATGATTVGVASGQLLGDLSAVSFRGSGDDGKRLSNTSRFAPFRNLRNVSIPPLACFHVVKQMPTM